MDALHDMIRVAQHIRSSQKHCLSTILPAVRGAQGFGLAIDVPQSDSAVTNAKGGNHPTRRGQFGYSKKKRGVVIAQGGWRILFFGLKLNGFTSLKSRTAEP